MSASVVWEKVVLVVLFIGDAPKYGENLYL